jgi:hypothetical protein
VNSYGFVTTKEIPKRELRENKKGRYLTRRITGYNKRNPKKGIESLFSGGVALYVSL